MPSDPGGSVQTWIGNTAPPDAPGLPPAVTDLWVDRDGTAYGIAPGELASPSLSICRKGSVEALAMGEGFVIAGNRAYLFLGTKGGVRLLPKAGLRGGSGGRAREEGWIPCGGADDLFGADASALPSDGFAVRGLHATERFLYLSHAPRNRVQQWDLRTRRRVREWTVRRPGALVADPWEGLWVVSEPEPGRDASLLRIGLRDGRVLETLSGVEAPTALAITLRSEEENHPALLVADNGPAQQILRFSRKDPRRSRPLPPLGNRYGLQGSAAAGAMNRRFHGLVGLGVALDGTLVVAQNWDPYVPRRGDYRPRCAEILAFTSRGALRFEAQALDMGAPVALSPEPPHDLFCGNVKLRVDWSDPALPWRLAGCADHPLLLTESAALGGQVRHPVLRSVLGALLLFAAEGETMRLFRQDPSRFGEAWIPLGAIRPDARADAFWAPRVALADQVEARLRNEAQRALSESRTDAERRMLAAALEEQIMQARSQGWIWMDGRGAEPLDGVFQDDEVESLDCRLDSAVWSVDSGGGLWVCGHEVDPRRGVSGMRLDAWIPERQDPNGMPVYRRWPSQPLPSEFAAGTVHWHRYLPALNHLLLAGTTPFFAGPVPQVLCRYADWWDPLRRQSAPRRVGQVLLGGGLVAEGAPLDAAPPAALELAGDWLLALRTDPPCVQAYDLRLGNRVATVPIDAPPGLRPGPGRAGLAAVPRADGSVALAVSLPRADRLLAIRWTPPREAGPELPQAPLLLRGFAFDRCTELCWTTGDAGRIAGYHVYRSIGDDALSRLTEEPLAAACYRDGAVQNGQVYAYAVSVVTPAGEGPCAAPLRLVPNRPVARFVGEDRLTLGDWRGRYGSLGHLLFGEGTGTGHNNPRLPEGVDVSAASFGARGGGPAPEVRSDPALPWRTAEGCAMERVVGVLHASDRTPAVLALAIRNGRSLRTSLYCGSSEKVHGLRVELADPETGALLDAREFSNESEPAVRGRYLTWDVTGTVLVRLTPPRETPLPDQCGVNAVFFDPASSLSPRAAVHGQ